MEIVNNLLVGIDVKGFDVKKIVTRYYTSRLAFVCFLS